MSKHDGAKVVTSGIIDEEKGSHRGFQSAAAAKAAVKPESTEDEDQTPVDAEVSRVVQTAPSPVEVADTMRMVEVRSRTYIPPFWYGKKQYSLQANKTHVIPLAVKRHLEEKNLL